MCFIRFSLCLFDIHDYMSNYINYIFCMSDALVFGYLTELERDALPGLANS